MNKNSNPATEKALAFYKEMVLIRTFEEKVLELFNKGILRGTTHVCIGQEAVATGACSALKKEDYITSNHRGHGHLIARGCCPEKLMAELFGKENGYSKGTGGSQHIAVKELNFLGSNGITAGSIPIATGAALQIKFASTNAISAVFTGDGATAQGTFHESLNMASVMKLPLLIIVENNKYAMSTPLTKTCPFERIAKRADGYGIESITVDGNDPFMVASAVADAREYIIKENRPYLIEAVTTRLKGHSRSDDCSYIPEGLIEEWHSCDPIKQMEEILGEHETNQDELDSIKKKIVSTIDNIIKSAQTGKAFPVEEYTKNIFAGSPETDIKKQNKKYNLTYAQAINKALDDSLKDNKQVILLGEDIAEYGGAFKVTRDLFEKYGSKRIINTPISENSFTGMAVGAAMAGMRPVVEIMFMDFIMLALDQIANHAAKFSQIYGGQYNIPITIRTPAGGRRGYGATHSQSLESLLFKIPGLKIFSPYSIQDAYGLTMQAIGDNNPVILLEHKLLYSEKGTLDFSKELKAPGKAAVLKEGKDLTIISYSYMLKYVMEAAEVLEQNEVSAEVIDLRTIVPLDIESLTERVVETQKVVVVEEGTLTGGIGSELAARIQEKCFGYLEAPVLRVAARDSAIPACKDLEDKILPQVQDILDAAKRLLGFS